MPELKTGLPKLEIGQDIYVPTSLRIDRGIDDVVGGLARVVKIEGGKSAGETVPYVSVAEHPGVQYNWKSLSERQAELEAKFGSERAGKYPDYRQGFNPGPPEWKKA